jgi:hypothetical protein
MDLRLSNLKKVVLSVAPLTHEAWKDFSSLFANHKLNRGSYFCKEGDYPEKVGFVCKGVLRTFYRTDKGVEYNKTLSIENSFTIWSHP